MFDDLKANVKDWSNEDEIREYLLKLLNREAFDKAGLIYGMGHAVYSLSDPRSKILSRFVKQLSEEKGREEEYHLYTTVERLAKQVIGEKRKIYKGVVIVLFVQLIRLWHHGKNIHQSMIVNFCHIKLKSIEITIQSVCYRVLADKFCIR